MTHVSWPGHTLGCLGARGPVREITRSLGGVSDLTTGPLGDGVGGGSPRWGNINIQARGRAAVTANVGQMQIEAKVWPAFVRNVGALVSAHYLFLADASFLYEANQRKTFVLAR